MIHPRKDCGDVIIAASYEAIRTHNRFCFLLRAARPVGNVD